MRRASVALIRFIFLCLALVGSPASAERLSALTWRDDAPELGGLSGLEISEDGSQLWVLSDRGFLITADVLRLGGAISRLQITDVVPLLDTQGQRAGRRAARDSEGLVRTADGRIVISYEGRHRISEHGADGVELDRFPAPLETSRLADNGSFEGLAQGPDGTFYTLTEDGEDGPAPLYRLRAEGWDLSWQFPRSDGFAPVGLDMDDRGRLYVLERRFNGLSGFTTRLRRFEIGDSGLQAAQTLLEFGTSARVNFEGLGLWRDAAGGLVATLVSDDNFRALFRTRIEEYRLSED
ncbi:esterase-like activity of phytase family protein [Fontisubflavum oceani]|uniref:esterase-like activity of phytase family protein n=1 Tax=Fontisubflavum oceani TaxID=2978973 RepID=UPI0025B5075B|nr:esterase-like activity of phytase family protein [Fontisubflavum oceani]WJY22688.1 esterase-like activity of phytase family protein [Fontisubflavum oceani]